MNKAIYWYKKSAEQGHNEAQYSLAILYEDSDEIDEDLDKAVYWYKKSGIQDIDFDLVLINNVIYWYEKSAEQGHQEAQYNLALVCENKKEMDKAIYWYEKSAEQGDKVAQNNLEIGRAHV